MQYFIKFVSPQLANQGPGAADLKERLDKLGSNMSLTRKVLRFGKPLPLLKAIMDRTTDH